MLYICSRVSFFFILDGDDESSSRRKINFRWKKTPDCKTTFRDDCERFLPLTYRRGKTNIERWRIFSLILLVLHAHGGKESHRFLQTFLFDAFDMIDAF